MSFVLTRRSSPIEIDKFSASFDPSSSTSGNLTLNYTFSLPPLIMILHATSPNIKFIAASVYIIIND